MWSAYEADYRLSKRFLADRPAIARKYSYRLKVVTHGGNVTTYLVSQYVRSPRSAFGLSSNTADESPHL